MKSPLVTIVCASMSPPLRRVLTSFLVEVAPLTFVGRLNTRTRQKLWEEINSEFSQHEMTMIFSTLKNEQGFSVITNRKASKYVTDLEGLTLSVRRAARTSVWETILGKSLPARYPLIRHLVDTAMVAESIWDRMLSRQQRRAVVNGVTLQDGATEEPEDFVRDLVIFIAGMHDIGKAHPHWQRGTLGIEDGDESLVDQVTGKTLQGVSIPDDSLRMHHYNSAAFFSLPSGSTIQGCRARRVIADVCQGHHGTFKSSDKSWMKRNESALLPDGWLDAQLKIEEAMLELIGIKADRFLALKSLSNPAIVIITGIVILADWIASRSDFINGMGVYNGVDWQAQKARKKALSYLEEFGLCSPQWRNDLSWSSIFPSFSEPNSLQASLVSFLEGSEKQPPDEPGILLINAPMGMGKTEASLYASAMLGSRLGTSGIWMNLPTQATSDAMFTRASEIAHRIFLNKENAVSLMHGNSAISTAIEGVKEKTLANDAVSFSEHIDDGDSSTESNLFISEFLVEKKLGGMSAIAVSTIDQLINASTRLKHNALRWLAISGKTLILDEVHDFDEYTFALIKKTVEWCGALGVPVIAMSATLSGRAQRELVNAYYKRDKEAMNRAQRESLSESIDLAIPKEGLPSPYWVYFPAGNAAAAVHSSKLELPKYPTYNASLDVVSDFVPSVVIRTAEHLEKDAMVLVVCHTVKQAVETYRTLRAEMPEEDIQLLHSRMAQERKAEVIDDLLVKTGKPDGKGNNSRNRMVLVTTQIVQQSMDIDFDVLITPLAPLPELFQRVGRIYRHEQGDERASAYRNSPRLHILVQEDVANYRSFTSTKDFSEQGQASFAPYSKWALLSSYEVLVKTLGKVNTCASWDAKSTMSQSFTAHEELRGACKNGLDSVPALLVSVHKEHESTIKEKEAKGEFAAISAPGEDPAVLYDITESFTPRSAKASPTRLIEETETVLPVWLNDKGEWFLDENCKQPMPKASSMQSLRMIGKKSLNIPKHLADKYIEPLADLDERYAFVTYVKPFDVTQLDESLGFSREEGFVPAVVVPSQTTWL